MKHPPPQDAERPDSSTALRDICPWQADHQTFEAAFRGIFERRFFANHGPLEHQLDAELAGFFGTRHAISVANGTTALMLAMRSLNMRGAVLMPALAPPSAARAVIWAGLRPVFTDVAARSLVPGEREIAAELTTDACAILGVHPWGRACDVDALQSMARRHGLRLLFDARRATLGEHRGRRIAGFGDAEVFSFQPGYLLGAAGGGCITTNDDALAARLRAARSFHDSPHAAPGLLRMNAKISEAQAAMALISIAQIPRRIEHLRGQHTAYAEGLKGVRGMRLLAPPCNAFSEALLLRLRPKALGVTLADAVNLLTEQGVPARPLLAMGLDHLPGLVPASNPLPNTEKLCGTLLSLPLGPLVTEENIRASCAALKELAQGRADGPPLKPVQPVSHASVKFLAK